MRIDDLLTRAHRLKAEGRGLSRDQTLLLMPSYRRLSCLTPGGQGPRSWGQTPPLYIQTPYKKRKNKIKIKIIFFL